MTHFVNPSEVGGDLVPYLVDLTGGNRLEDINQAFDLMHAGESIRSVMTY